MTKNKSGFLSIWFHHNFWIIQHPRKSSQQIPVCWGMQINLWSSPIWIFLFKKYSNNLSKYYYTLVKRTMVLWRHKTEPVNFTLVLFFGVLIKITNMMPNRLNWRSIKFKESQQIRKVDFILVSHWLGTILAVMMIFLSQVMCVMH